MGQFDSHQTRIESLKKPEAPDKLKQTLENKSAVLTTAVDQGETVLDNAAKELKSPKAKAYLGKAASEVSAILAQIAQQGFALLQDKNKVDAGIPSIESLISSLSQKLADQARIIGEFKSYEEKEKQVDVFVNAEKEKTATGDKFIAAERDLNNAKIAVPPKSKEEIAGLQKAVDELRGQYVAKMKGLDDLYEPFKQPGYLASMESEVYETFYKLRTEKFAPAEASYKKSLEGLELIEKEQGRTESNAEIEGIKEATIKLEVEMQQYAALVEELNANWPDADPEKKKDCESREQALLSAYSAAKTTLDQIKAKSDKDEIYWIDPADLAAAAKPVTENIKKIESYKTERSLRARIGDDSKYLTFYTNEEGFRSYKENTAESGKIKTWNEHNVIFRNIKNHLSDARAEVKKETQKAEMDAMLKGSKDKREALENKLGEKGKKYFEALTALQAGDSEKAATLLTQYTDQKFTEEDLTLHAGLIEQAKEQLDTINQSKAFYAAMGLIKGGDQKGGVTQLNSYLASAEKLPPEKKAAHEGQIEAAKETIKGIGLSNVNLMEDVFEDMVTLRVARRKMGGGHLHYSESMEDEYYKSELSDLREKIIKGECLDPFTEIAAARKRVEDKVKSKVEAADWKQEDSLLNEAQDLFEAMHNMDPKVREKALVDFAKRARGEKAYDLARKYLERALEPMYREFEQKVNKYELQKYMLGDPEISKWLKENAKTRYEKMKEENNLAGLTYDDVFNQLVQYKMQDVMRKEMRRQMTSEGLAGVYYQAAAKGSMLEKMVANHQIIFQPTRFQSLTMTEGTNEALLLYNEYFKGEDSAWYNPTTWGAEAWDDFEDATISFAFETVMSLGIGVGAGAAGKAAGKAVAKALLKRGVSRAAIATIEKGGISALRAVIKGETKGVLKAYLARQAATIAAEGATMFTLGTIQSGVMDPTSAAQQFSAWWEGPLRLGEAMVKSAMYRVVGATGARFLGNNPALWKEITEHVGSGIAGEGVEYLGIVARSAIKDYVYVKSGSKEARSEAEAYTAKDFIRGMIQDSFQAGGRKFGSGVRRRGQMSQGEIRARKAAAEHDLDAIGAGNPDKIGGVEVRRHKQDGVEVVEYVVRGEKGARVFRADDMSVLSPEVRRRIESEAAKSESATPKVSPPGEKPKEQGPYRTPAEKEGDIASPEMQRLREEAKKHDAIKDPIQYRLALEETARQNNGQPPGKNADKARANEIVAEDARGVLAYNENGILEVYKDRADYELNKSKRSPEKTNQTLEPNEQRTDKRNPSEFKIGDKEIANLITPPAKSDPRTYYEKLQDAIQKPAQYGIKPENVQAVREYAEYIKQVEQQIETMRERAKPARDVLDSIMDDVAGQTRVVREGTDLIGDGRPQDGNHNYVPIKGMPRSMEKVVSPDLNGSVKQLRDLARGTLEYDSVHDLQSALALIKADPRVVRLNIKNNIGDPFGKTDHSEGYRDMNLNMEVRTPDGKTHVVELQLHIKKMLETKEKGRVMSKESIDSVGFEPGEMNLVKSLDPHLQIVYEGNVVNGHVLYEISRKINKKSPAKLQKLKERIDKLRKKLHDETWADIMSEPQNAPKTADLVEVAKEYNSNPKNKNGNKARATDVLTSDRRGVLAYDAEGFLRTYKHMEEYYRATLKDTRRLAAEAREKASAAEKAASSQSRVLADEARAATLKHQILEARMTGNKAEIKKLEADLRAVRDNIKAREYLDKLDKDLKTPEGRAPLMRALQDKYPKKSPKDIEKDANEISEATEVVRTALADHPQLANVLVRYLLDVAHPMNIGGYLRNPQSRPAVLKVLKEMASGGQYTTAEMQDIVRRTQTEGQDPLFRSDDANFTMEGDKKRPDLLRDLLLNADTELFSMGDNPTPGQRRSLGRHARRLEESVMPDLVKRLHQVAGAVGENGFPAVNARAKSADGIVDKIHRMRTGGTGKQPRPNYSLADVPDAVGGRITVENASDLPRVMRALESTFGKSNIYEKDNFYSNPKKGQGAYRVITYTVLVQGIPCEVQVTTLQSSISADLWHNTGYKRLHPDLPYGTVQRMAEMQRTVAAREHGGQHVD